MNDRTLQLFKTASRNARRAPRDPRNRAATADSPPWMKLNRAPDKADALDLYIFGVITPFAWFEDEVSASQILDKLDGITASTIRVHLKSDGGSVFDGIAIYNLLRAHDARIEVRIDSLAASIASVIAMAGDEILISEAASMMIHEPTTIIWGNSTELRAEADVLDTIRDQIVAVYARRTGIDRTDLARLMEGESDGTWMSGEQAVERGFADRLLEGAAADENAELEQPAARKTISTDPGKGESNTQTASLAPFKARAELLEIEP